MPELGLECTSDEGYSFRPNDDTNRAAAIADPKCQNTRQIHVDCVQRDGSRIRAFQQSITAFNVASEKQRHPQTIINRFKRI